MTLKLRHADFRTITRARSLAAIRRAIRRRSIGIGRDLLAAQLPVPEGVRLLGLTLSGIVDAAAPADDQPSLPL